MRKLMALMIGLFLFNACAGQDFVYVHAGEGYERVVVIEEPTVDQEEEIVEIHELCQISSDNCVDTTPYCELMYDQEYCEIEEVDNQCVLGSCDCKWKTSPVEYISQCEEQFYVEPDPVEPDPVEPDPVEPDPVEPDPVCEHHISELTRFMIDGQRLDVEPYEDGTGFTVYADAWANVDVVFNSDFSGYLIIKPVTGSTLGIDYVYQRDFTLSSDCFEDGGTITLQLGIGTCPGIEECPHDIPSKEVIMYDLGTDGWYE